MKKLFVLIVLLVGGTAVAGLYRGWFQVSSDGAAADDKSHVTLTVDKNKIHEDEAKALDKVEHAADRAKEKVGEVAKH